MKRVVDDRTDIMIGKRYDLIPHYPAQADHDHGDFSNSSDLSNYEEVAVGYVSGYTSGSINKNIIKMVRRRIAFPECLCALTITCPGNQGTHKNTILLGVKDGGGFIKSSKDVITVYQRKKKFRKCYTKMTNNCIRLKDFHM